MVLSRKLAPAFMLVLVASMLIPGCSKSETTAEPSSRKEDTSKKETEAERCRKKLAGAIQRVTPAVLAFQDKPERSINSLNAWIASCAADEIEDLTIPEATLELIGDSARASSRRFTVSDAKYIRDCLLLRDLSDAIFTRCEKTAGDSGATDTERVTAIFKWISRNISLAAKDDERIPLSLSDVLMTGRGTTADRTWLFAEALRQQQIDAVVIGTDAPAGEGGIAETASTLIAVFLEEKKLLFDPLTGLRVNLAGDLLNGQPASLDVLGASERWQNASIEIVATVTAFAPRMLVLQEQLAAGDAAILYEELTGGLSDILPLIDRIKAGAGDFNSDNIQVWEYPEQQTVAANALDEAQRQAYTNLMRPFQAPFERKTYQSESFEELTTVPEELSEEEREILLQNRLLEEYSRMFGSSEDKFGKPSNGLLKARLKQTLGQSVIPQLQQVRISSMQKSMRIRIPEAARALNGGAEIAEVPFPEVILKVNQSSTGDSLYWIAMCQMDSNEYGTAINTLANYRRQHPGGPWTYPSIMNQTLCLIAQERIDDARMLLKDADKEDNPERQRVQLMLAELGGDRNEKKSDEVEGAKDE